METKTIPILPFDITLGESLNMYDKMPYVRDLTICGNEMIQKESGNVIKFYQYTTNEPYLINSNQEEN